MQDRSTTSRAVIPLATRGRTIHLGHAHPHLVGTLRRAADRVWHISNNYRIPEQERLAERLVAASFADRAFFCNSGLEAAEAAIKLARLAHFSEGRRGRHRIITLSGAFHGRSLAALAATNNPKYLEGFGPVVPGFSQVAFGGKDELSAAISDDVAAVMLEPLQGEGGVRLLQPGYLRWVRELCDETGILLVFDEVQCGMGRTGKLFAHEWAGVTPDIMMLAKGVGGGFPIGAVLATERVARAMTPGCHGTTFGGNPLAMAVANAVLDVLTEPGFLDRVEQVARALLAGLSDFQRHPDIFTEVRGTGLLLGLRCIPPAGDCVEAARAAHLLTHTAGDNVLRLLPPLIIEPRHVDEALSCLHVAAAHIATCGREAAKGAAGNGVPGSHMSAPRSDCPSTSDFFRRCLVCDTTLPGMFSGLNEPGVLHRYRAAGVGFVSVTVGNDSTWGPGVILRRLATLRAAIARDDRLVLAQTGADIRCAHKEGKLAVGFHLQGTNALGGELSWVEAFARLGVGHMLLAYNARNAVADGCAERTDAGLSRFGFALIEEMQRVGVIVDGSHTGYRATMEAMEQARRPFIFSHANAHAVHAHYRNIKNDQIKACARTGGFVGINGVGAYLGPTGEVSAELIFRHVDHVAGVAGSAHVAFGLDFIADVAAFAKRVQASSEQWPDNNGAEARFDHFAGPEAIEEVAELALRRGYTEGDVESLLGGNVLRVFEPVCRLRGER